MGARKPLSKKRRFAILRRDDFTCQYCGRSSPEVQLHVDHVIPVAVGGTNRRQNLVTSCQDCNLGKGTGPSKPPAFEPVPETQEDEVWFDSYCDHSSWITVLRACGEEIVL